MSDRYIAYLNDGQTSSLLNEEQMDDYAIEHESDIKGIIQWQGGNIWGELDVDFCIAEAKRLRREEEEYVKQASDPYGRI